MNNSLENIKRSIKYLAKRYKGISYSTGLVLLFAMLGVNAFSEEIIEEVAVANSTNIIEKSEIKTSADRLSEVLRQIKEENEKKLNGANLELIQLMEQGDQVVKSPWASWQFGINYFYSDDTGRYKGRGDKSRRYPYEGIFVRSDSIFERYTSPDSSNYSKLKSSNNSGDPKLKSLSASKMATTSLRKGLGSKEISEVDYGITSIKRTREPITSFEVAASINPRTIEKSIKEPNIPPSTTFELPEISVASPAAPTVTSNPPVINVGAVHPKTVNPPVLPKAVDFNLPEINVTSPAAPTVESNIPTVNVGTVQPKTVNPPVLPKAITFELPEINVDTPVAPTVTSNPPVINVGAVHPKTVTPPVLPKAITFNLPVVNVNAPTAPTVTPNIPVINVPTVTPKQVNVPDLPKAIAFDVPKIEMEAPTAPTITPATPTVAIPTVTPNVASTPELPEAIDFNPVTPKVVIPKDPALPEPPTFAVVLGADCNSNCPSNGQTRRYTKLDFNTSPVNTSLQNVNSILHYTWTGSDVPEPGAKGLAFKMWQEENSSFVGTPDTIYFNSYNFGKDGSEFNGPILIDNNYAHAKNGQYFFVGGSRFIEIDNRSSGTYTIPNNKTVNLGGILTLGLVSQENGSTLRNEGVLTDLYEKDEDYIKNMPYDTDTNGDLINDALKIKGPTSDYYVKRNEDGYVGYKVGIAQVQENGLNQYSGINQKLENSGKINFFGERSIGMYVYLPTSTSAAILKNDVGAEINLSGKESYGMKFASRGHDNAAMENLGTINLRKNPNGNSKADNSAAIALMKDNSVTATGGVSLARGKAVNKGTIELKDVQNSLGAYVNIDSDITNEKDIKINSIISEATSDQPVNIGMRADGHQNAEVINKSTGKITLNGSYAIAMLAKGSKLKNEGKITTETNVSNGIGIVGIDNAKIENSGSIKITGDKNNIGVFLKNGSTGTIGTAGSVTQSIEVKGNESTGVLVTKGEGAGTTSSSLEMAGNVKVSGNAISGIVADTSTIILKNSAEVTVDNNGAAAGAIGDRGSYGIVVKGAAGKFIGEDTNVTAKITTNKSTGLYSEGQLIVKNANITTSDGATNFYAKDNGEIELKGNDSKSETGQKSLLFYTDGTNAKIKITGKMEAKIKGGTSSNDRGTAFLYQGNSYSKFDSAAITTFATDHFGGTLSNLTLDMEAGSRLFAAQDVAMNLSDTNTTGLATALGGVTFKGSSDYKTFMLYDSKLTVNQNVNLNDTNDAYNKLEISSSSIENNSDITGSKTAQVAIAQENTKATKSRVTLTNNGKIELTGDKSTGIYAKFGIINNNAGKIISVGTNSTGIYALNNTEVNNNGEIKIGENSTGIFYSDKNSKTSEVYDTKTNLKNVGKITLLNNNSIGMTYEAGKIVGTPVIFENSGTIEGKTGTKNVGMYAKQADTGSYDAINTGIIKLGDASSSTDLNIGMYTDASLAGKTTLKNTGTLEIGNYGIGMFGYDLKVAGNGSIKVGDSGIAMYSKGGNIDITGTPTIEIGKNKAVAVYTNGTSQLITSIGATTYKIGDSSYGFVNKGTGNNFNISGGSATLSNEGIFIYSSDKTGSIINGNNITSTGTIGKNYGIYSTGTVNNSGNIDFTTGIGNIGIYAIDSKADVTNIGEIKLGASTQANRSIGIIANDGKVDNSGKITVNGNYGLGLYSTGSGTINNSGNITVTGDETAGAYASGKANINLKGGTIAVNGKKATGYYLNEGTNSQIDSAAKVNVEGNESTGVFVNKGTLTYKGETTVKGDGVYGLVADKNSTINATGGSLTVTGTGGNLSNQTANRGTAAVVVNDGAKILGNNLDVTAKITGKKSMGLYSKGELKIDSANITTSNGAVNFFADGGTISVGNNGGTSTVETGIGTDRGSLLFYTKSSGKILINGQMNATVKGSADASKTGTAFLFEGSGSTYSPFTTTKIQDWAKTTFGDGTTSTLNKLTLHMDNNSRLFVASNVAMNLSDTNPTGLQTALGLGGLTGSNYKTFMLYNSKLTVNQNVNLNNTVDPYNNLEISSSSIENNSKIEGSHDKQVAIAQENATGNRDRVILRNNKEITLTGDKSTGIYAKFGKIENTANGVISVGKNSTGIYALNNTEINNNGEIKIGTGSTGIFYSDIQGTTIYNTTTGLKNEGTITLAGQDAMGMYYEPGNIGTANVTFENTTKGEIIATSNSTVGMYAKVSKDSKPYETVNAGKITLQHGTTANPTIAMYTNATTKGINKLTNTGTIAVGNNGIGMYGYDETTSGNITVGDKGIALYTQGGAVNVVNTSTLKVGETNAVGIYATGNKGTITSAGKYEIGKDSYGIVNKGTGNNITITGGTAKLTGKGKFIYSSDTTGTIKNAAKITSTGNENYGIYSNGKVINTGEMDLTVGTGNTGILVTTGTGNAENSGTIKVGTSGIGIIANDSGKANNTGAVEVAGANGIGLYTATGGTITNTTGKVITNGNSTIGAYAAGNSNINLTGGEIKVSGKSATGYYLDGGTNSTIAAAAKVNVTGDESTGLFVNTGKLKYSGETTVKGDGVYGAVVRPNGTIEATGGTLTVEGDQTANRGTIGLVVQNNGKITGKGLDIVAKVSGEKSVGVYSAGNAEIGKANITTSNGAINFFAENGTISINKPSTVVTGTGTNSGSLLFYAPSATSKILINAPMTATVKGDADASKTGTAFFYQGQTTPGYTPLTAADITMWKTARFNNTLSKLTLNMENNSRLFTASKVKMNLTDTNATGLKNALGIGTLTGSNYKTFMLYNSHLTINKDVNLDSASDDYRRLEISNSSIVNDKKIKGTQANQVAIAQENNLTDKNAVIITNNGSIELSGNKSTAIYAKKGKIINNANGTIAVGKQSSGIYALNNTVATNEGKINAGESSTGIFYSDVEGATTYDTKTGLKNEGTITLTGPDAVGMYYEPGNIGTANVTFENAATGKITAIKDSTEGMYAKKSKDGKSYNTINAGTIALKNGTTTNPTIAMYTDATSTGTNPLKNTGTITVGNSGIGMYGYEEETTGKITVGDAGIALYTQGGTVNVANSSTLKVGNNDAVGIYATGNNSTITSAGKYEIGNDSYGIIDKGTGNTVTVSGTAKLSNKGKFIYSEDKTGTVTNAATITSTGGENYGIYSNGTVKNTGTMNLATGTGNIGILVKSATGDAENTGTIKVGASTTAKRSIGIVANDNAKAKNTGKIEVTGANGLGLYAVNAGTIENATGGTITTTGDSTIGAYAADTANINLTGGEVNVSGKSAIGYYLDKGQNSKVTSPAKITVTGDKTTGLFVNAGKLTYTGATTVKGNGVYGAVVGANGEIAATSGTINVAGTSGASNQTTNRGTVGLVVQNNGKVTGNGLDVTAKVVGGKSVGIYSAGTAEIGAANITTSNGAVNFFADSGTISINEQSTVETGTGADRGSLLFYAPTNTSKILINAAMTATVKGHTDASRTGTAFFYQGSGPGYSSFTAADIGTWKTARFNATLANLTLNMENNSRLFTASKVAMNLSNTSGSALAGALGTKIVGSNYKTFMLYNSQLTIDKNVDLDDPNDDYRRLEISNSSIINNKQMTGTQANQVAIAQENALADKNAVTITNNGSIELTGANSTAIYTKNGKIVNAATGKITTKGTQSAGIYALNNTEISNKGAISVGKDSTGIFYSDVETKVTHNTSTGLKNEGTITLAGQDAVGMYYEPGKIGTNIVRFENAGKIIATSDSTEGMYAKVSKDKKSYDTVNTGTITLKNGTTANPTIAMYTDATTKGTNPLKNEGTITVGNNGIGMYGFEESTSGNITVGDAGIALYTQGGAVDVASTSTLKVGKSDAVGIYATGNKGTITSAGNYDIGNDSYGIIDVGSNNTIKVTSGTAKLAERGKFIYSKDTTSKIENAAKVTATGGENYGIYATGTVKNTGDMDLTAGTGNIGILIKNGGTAENSGTIKVGASTATKRGIGIVANNSGKAKNTGAVEVAGANGLGLYALNGGTVENATGGTITTTGDSTVGAYAADTANINLTGGEVKVTGKSTIGYYLDKGTNSTVTSNAKINVTGNESTGLFVSAGKLTYNGTTTVKGDGVYGAVVDKGTVAATSGTITVEGTSGASNQTANRGTVGLVVQTGGTITGNGLNVAAKVTGEKSVGVYSAGNASIGAANITTSNGAVNFFAEDGTISINKASTVETGTGANRGSLLFYAPTATSKILINAPMTATVKGDADASKTGTAFFYQGQGTGYSTFTAADLGTWKTARFGSTLSNLTLNMQDKSRLFTASKVAMKLSDTSGAALAGALGANIVGSNYKTFMLYNSQLTIDKDVNLDNANDDYRKLEISSSSIINNKKIKGTQANQVAIAQETGKDAVAVTITNNGSIELTGDKSTAIYTKNGKVINAAGGTITTTGAQSAGIYALNNTEVSNKGKISVGKDSTGMFYSDITDKGATVYNTKTGLKNEGTITLAGQDAVGMYYEPGNIGTNIVKFENAGKIIGTSNSTEGMYAKVSKDGKSYDTVNAGTIALKNGTTTNPTIAMYTDATTKGTNPLKNIGTITVGNSGIGMYGYDETTSGNITVGDKGIALYTQGGTVNVANSSTLKVGNSDAVGIYATGNNGTITSAGNYEIGNDSYGIIDVGAGNTINVSGTAKLSNRGKFIYSKDTTGTVENAATITSTGGENYGIYSSGKVKNTGNINLATGIGNIGLLVKSATGNAENTGTIKVGASTTAKRSIGIVANDNAKAKNTGKIEVTGANGLGLYAVTGGTIENATGGTITATGDSTIGAYAADTANINLTGGEVKVSGKSAIGYYLDKGQNSKVTSPAKITVTGDESTGLFVSAGKLAYNGATTVKGNGVYGAVVGANGEIAATSGTINVAGTSGASNQTTNRGTVGLVVQTNGKVTGNGLDVTAKVAGGKSVGIYSAGTAEIGAANITTSNGAVNFFADSGTISINKASTVETGTGADRGSLLFYAPTNTSKILINAAMTATVKGHTDASRTGTAFFYQGQGAGYSSFTASDIGTWKTARFGSTLSNLALNMQDNSRLFTASKVAMNLSDTSGTGIKTALGLGALTGSNYKTFMLYNSKLTIDKDVNLDNANDDYRRLEISNSSIINNKKIKGTQANQVAIAQENILPDKSAVTITNNGSIELTGPNSTAIYAKNGIIENAAGASITTTGKESIGIFHSDTGSAASLKNRGNITVGDAGTAIYSKGGSIDLAGGTITTGAEEAVGVFTVGTKQNISNTGTTFDLKNNSFGFVNTGKENTITTASTTTAKLGKDSVYIYSDDVKGKVENGTNLTSTGDRNYGIYAAGTVTNTGNINFATGTGNVGIYTIKGGNAINRGIISIGASDVENESYGIGMAIGGDKNSNGGSITNKGTILVQDANSIGMYGSGKGVKVKNDSKITLNANSTTGIYLDNGAEGINTGVIETGKAGLSKVVGVYLGQNTTLNNQGSIRINATDGVGIYLKGGMVKNYGTINVTGTDSKDTYEYKPADTSKGLDDVKIDTKPETPIITRNGIKVSPFIAKEIKVDPKTPEVPSIDGKAIEGIDTKDLAKYKRDELVSKDSIGMYIDTSGINKTKPIEGLERLTDKADLIVGTEASKYTINKDIIIKDPEIIKPYREAMLKNKKVTNWNIYSGSLTWTATASLDKNGYIDSNIVMSKIPYTAWAGDKALPVAPSDVYNFTNGLEQRYGVDGLGTKENKLFQKLNSIGKNEEILLHQAFDEMMGHQYGNLQQRIQATGSVLDREFSYLRREWRTASKDSNKLKVFGMNGEYSTDTAGIIDYKSKAYGVAYVGENETFRLGDTTGWYTGIVHNTNKFKDIGNSKEEMLQAKLGIFKSEAFDENNSLNWTISGEGFVGYNKMDRKYLVVNETFGAKAKYWTYGVAVKNELSKDFRLTEDFNFRVYGSMKAEYGRFEKIKEKNGQVKLEIKANDYYSIKPELGAEIGYKQPMGLSMLNARVGIAYENELGKVANAKNKARVAHTNADWFNVRGEKEDRRGNIKLDFNVGYDNSRYGVTANVGYDTKGENIRGGLGLRVIF